MEALEITAFGFNLFFQTASFLVSLATLYLITKSRPVITKTTKDEEE